MAKQGIGQVDVFLKKKNISNTWAHAARVSCKPIYCVHGVRSITYIYMLGPCDMQELFSEHGVILEICISHEKVCF
jgi:hypothetical protein